MTHLCFVLFFVCLCVCVCECLLHNNMRMYMSNQYLHVRGPLRECRSILQALPDYPITAHHLYVSLMQLSRWVCGGITKTKNQNLLHTTHQLESVGQPGQSTTSIETPKVKNSDPIAKPHTAPSHPLTRLFPG